jgi:hypothetical protein
MIGSETAGMDARWWNEHLFQTVFSTTTSLQAVSIINATDGFLAHVAGDAADS